MRSIFWGGGSMPVVCVSQHPSVHESTAMADEAVPGDCTPLPKSVQEMSAHGDEPPPSFLVSETIVSSSSPSSLSIPVIDMGLLPSSEEELLKLKSALHSAGYFQAVGHGIPDSFLDEVRKVATEFFALPLEEKNKRARAANEVEGYGHDMIVSEKQVLDWSSRLFLRVFPEHQRRLNLWPSRPDNFGNTLHEYALNLKVVMDVLFKAMAKSLKLEEDIFLQQFGVDPVMQVRFNFYPPCSHPDKVLGVKPHSDRSGVTVLLQDESVEGLQILKDGTWITVPVIPHALVINLGDQMQIMTNGIFKSPIHRVVTNSDKLRISVAMFNEPEPDKDIGPVENLLCKELPRLYKNVKNYAAFNYECFQKGKIPLEEVKVETPRV